MPSLSWWIGFNVFVIAMLLVDLFVFNRKAHEISIKESLIWSVIWTVLALVFNVWVYHLWGKNVALQFLTGYILERSLSFDNLFVFLLLFNFFRVKAEHQHSVLFWGIVGALVMRAAFIFAGVAILHAFHWVIYVFGAILAYTGIKLIFEKEKEISPEKNIVLKLFRRIMPVTKDYHGGKFFCRVDGKIFATPMFVVLLVIETTDVVFALDSIPAIFGITLDPFIIYTSNIFAILGLRALYFALAGLMRLFHYLHYGLGLILVFIGIKMLADAFIEIPVAVALGVVSIILVGSIIVSIVLPHKPNS